MGRLARRPGGAVTGGGEGAGVGRAFLAASLLLLLAASGPAAAAADKAFLWMVRSDRGAAYLLGSIHYLKPEMYPLDPRIEEAYNASSALVVESDILAEGGQRTVLALLRSAAYPPGDSLEKHLSTNTARRLREAVGEEALPLLQRFRPWAAAMMVSSAKIREMGFDPRYGVDWQFLDKARGRKEILELESAEEQLSLLSSLPDPQQEQFLVYTLAELENAREEMDRILSAWSRGDAEAMEAVISRTARENPGIEGILDVLLYRRNRSMAEGIRRFMAPGKTLFVVVGAAHLVGKEGILERLRRQGFTVEQP